jgi:hypothetical protein
MGSFGEEEMKTIFSDIDTKDTEMIRGFNGCDGGI